jgi:hypothetical protein
VCLANGAEQAAPLAWCAISGCQRRHFHRPSASHAVPRRRRAPPRTLAMRAVCVSPIIRPPAAPAAALQRPPATPPTPAMAAGAVTPTSPPTARFATTASSAASPMSAKARFACRAHRGTVARFAAATRRRISAAAQAD